MYHDAKIRARMRLVVGLKMTTRTEMCKSLGRYSRGRTYVTITYVSKENNLEPGEKIRYN